MKALSLLQPWASLMFGQKRIETRSWDTLYRGPLVICASKKFSREQRLLCVTDPFFDSLGNVGDNLPLGVAIGRVDLVGCDRIGPTGALQFAHTVPFIWATEQHFGDFTEGRFAWLTLAAHHFPRPFPVRGRLGLFDVDDAQVEAAG